MLILIKSFKRPYLLDFTIQSIKKNVSGNYFIVVVDDGTPERYLIKLSEKYPDIKIIKSAYHSMKSKSDKTFLNYNKNIILPHTDWLNVIKKYSNDYVFILEDDQFITHKLDLESIKNILSSNKLMFLHFNVLNRFLDNNSKISNNIYYYNSKILLFKCLKFIFFTSRYYVIKKFRSILSRVNIKNFTFNFKRHALPIYDLYIISGVIYDKRYYIDCNINCKDELDEFAQLNQAVSYNLKCLGNVYFGMTIEQKVKTSFCSTVLSGSRGVDFNPQLFNQILNNYWYKENYVYFDTILWDVNIEVIKRILNESNSTLNADNWEKYTDDFKNNYRNLGYRI